MSRTKFILSTIFILGLLLRISFIDKVPPGLNRDEASIGYNAYSVLLTGKDEYQQFLPLSFKSFGDWKLPLYIYLDIIPIYLFGLTELSTKLPSIIFGSLSILITYLFVIEIHKESFKKKIIALLASLFLAISPWHIHFSRVASEANMAVFLVCMGLLFFVKGRKTKFYLYLSALLLALSLYTYHGNHIFTSLLFAGLTLILILEKYLKNYKKPFFIFLLIFLIPALIIFKATLFSADRTKISGLLPLNDPYSVYENIVLARLIHSNPSSKLTSIYHNKISFLVEGAIQGYLKGFSTEFLFIKGGGNEQHNIPQFGNLYIWESPFILFGLYLIFRNKLRWRYLLLLWLLISPIPASITKDAPHSARMLSFLPLSHILAAIGVTEIIILLRRIPKNIFISSSIFFLLIINFTFFLDRYFIHFPIVKEASWGNAYKELVNYVSQNYSKYNSIVMDRPNYSPYIFFLFYQRTDPSYYQKVALLKQRDLFTRTRFQRDGRDSKTPYPTRRIIRTPHLCATRYSKKDSYHLRFPYRRW